MVESNYNQQKIYYKEPPVEYDYSAIPITTGFTQPPFILLEDTFQQQENPSGRGESIKAYCPVCKNHIRTQVNHVRGATAWIFCLILCVFCFPFCIYPLICDPCLDVKHVCPHCESELAINNYS